MVKKQKQSEGEQQTQPQVPEIVDPNLIALLGLSREEIIERVIARIASGLLEVEGVDEYGDSVGPRPSNLQARLQAAVQKRADEKIAEIAEREILPRVGTFVETLTLQETNRWGEKTGKSMTFIEYLIQRAETYLTEQVDHQGKSASECERGYFSKYTSRTAFLIEWHLKHAIETAMRKAVADANKTIVGGLQEAVKIALEDVGKRLKVEVKS